MGIEIRTEEDVRDADSIESLRSPLARPWMGAPFPRLIAQSKAMVYTCTIRLHAGKTRWRRVCYIGL